LLLAEVSQVLPSWLPEIESQDPDPIRFVVVERTEQHALHDRHHRGSGPMPMARMKTTAAA
jgi:hypothetical protein